MGVDGRLSLYGGKRLDRLWKSDLPNLALAITGQIRGRCLAWRMFDRNIAYYRVFSADGRVDVYVRADDWKKIAPYIASGAWNPNIIAVPESGYLHPERMRDLALLPTGDQALYNRVLDDLEQEFPKDYPTSPL